jgi:protein SCO1
VIRNPRTAAAAIAIALAAAAGPLVASVMPANASAVARVNAPAPPVTLTDQAGRAFSLTSQAGNEVVLFFGYTHCADVCPMTLARLARIRQKLPPAARRRLVVAFITVDPRRDDAATLRRYVEAFDPSFLGLRGSRQDLERVYAAYGVWSAKLPPQPDGAYRVAHDGRTFVIDRHGVVRAIDDWQKSVAGLAADVATSTPPAH